MGMGSCEFRTGECEEQALYERILSELPSENDFDDGNLKPSVLNVDSFDELHKHQDGLRSGRLVIPRADFVEELYQKQLGYNRDLVLDGENIFELAMRMFVEKYKILLLPNFYGYDLPRDTMHTIMWYDKDVQPEQRAAYLTDVFWDDGVDSDFVIVKSRPSVRSVRAVNHDHIFLRRKASYELLKVRLDD